MAKYTYQEMNKSPNHASWIAKLQRINPVSLASSHHTEIYFTQPKDSEVEAMLWPHVTFVSSSGTTHWYLTNSGGKYGVERHDYRVAAHPNEATIAQNVIDDAVALTWIYAPFPWERASQLDHRRLPIDSRRPRMQTDGRGVLKGPRRTDDIGL